MSAVAPTAPGRLGEPVDPVALGEYLIALGRWRGERRRELDELDRAALAAPDRDALTADVTLAMAQWQAVATRHDDLERLWDSGRVEQLERLRLADLLWGRLDRVAGSAGGALVVSLPEACRISDAVTAQLRTQLSLDPVGQDVTARLRGLRAALERVRDLLPGAGDGPDTTAPLAADADADAAAQRLRRLDERLADVTRRAARGADVGGLIPPLEADAARAERDLIVGAATRRENRRDLTRARRTRDELLARSERVRTVADACVAQVTPAPRLAVPQVQNLGPIPAQAGAVDAYLARLVKVDRALTMAEEAYATALAERDELRERLGLYRAKAHAIGRDGDPEVAGAYQQARDVLGAVPTDLPRARAVVAAYQILLGAVPPSPAPTGRTS